MWYNVRAFHQVGEQRLFFIPTEALFSTLLVSIRQIDIIVNARQLLVSVLARCFLQPVADPVTPSVTGTSSLPAQLGRLVPWRRIDGRQVAFPRLRTSGGLCTCSTRITTHGRTEESGIETPKACGPIWTEHRPKTSVSLLRTFPLVCTANALPSTPVHP